MAVMGQDPVANDPARPSREIFAAVVLVKTPPEDQGRLLKHVVGILVIEHLATQVGIHPALAARVQREELFGHRVSTGLTHRNLPGFQ